MPNKQWKKVELDVARYFNSERNPLSGINSKHDTGSDTLHPALYVETKYGMQIPKFFTDIWAEATTNAKKEGKIPMVALKPKGFSGFLIITSSNDIDQIIKERLVSQ